MFGPQKVNNAVVSAEQNHISSFYADAATCSLPERSELNIALVVCIAVTCDEDAARAVVGESLPEPSLMWSPPPLPPFDEKDADDELREDDDADGESATNWSRRARDEPVNGGEASCALGNAKHSPRSEPPIMSPAGSNAPGLIGMPSIGDIGERHGLTGAHRLTWGDRYERLPNLTAATIGVAMPSLISGDSAIMKGDGDGTAPTPPSGWWAGVVVADGDEFGSDEAVEWWCAWTW